MRLAGKTVLLTGGGSGIGFALARQLAAKGARLALCGRRPEPLDEAVRVLRAAGGEAIRVRGDVAQEDDPARMVDDTVRQLRGPPLLITNPGNLPAGLPAARPFASGATWPRRTTAHAWSTIRCANSVASTC